MTDSPTRRRHSAGRGRDLSRPPLPEVLPAPVADSHCHLDIADGEHPLPVDEAITAAASVNVTRIVQVGCDLDGIRWAVRAAERHPSVVAAVAMHPNEVPGLAALGMLDDALAEVDSLAAHPRVRAVGETGLDHFRTPPEGRAVQEEAFRRHIAIAKAHGKTLVIHDRDAHADVLRVLDEEGAPERTVFHCYSGDEAMARHCADRGWFLSFAGTVTFKNAPVLRNALAATPLDLVLVETDAPYLTPSPHRGRPNASYLLPLTLRVMADARGTDVESLARAVDSNTSRAFGGAWTTA